MGNWVVYTDGSFDKNNPTEVHGACVIKNLANGNIIPVHVLSRDEELCSGWNIGGEVLAACAAISIIGLASKGQQTSLEIVYDCECAGKWCASILGTNQSGIFKITSKTRPSGQWCKDVMTKLRTSYPNLNVNWVWTKGHSTNEGNNLADKYANYDMQAAQRDGIKITELTKGDF